MNATATTGAQRRPTSARWTWRLFPVLALCVGALACSSPGPGAADTVIPGTYYTKFGLRLDRQVCRSTNYRSESFVLVPVNTQVEYLSVSRRRFKLQIGEGDTMYFEHMPKHTKDTPADAFASFFSSYPVDLSGFNDDEREAIERAEVRVGMSREAVLAAIGPPPAHETPSRESGPWKYWSSRFKTFLVHFGSDGRVSRIDR